jgi:myo-inositol-1(or 4)-monophosphatase
MVAKLVAGESEDKRADLPAEATWKIRKQETIDHLKTADRDTKLICLGDKLANIREMSRDYDKLQDKLWERFNQKNKALHAWYYRSVCDVLEAEFGSIPAIREYRTLLRAVFGALAEGANTEIQND